MSAVLISDQFGELYEKSENESRIPIADLPALHERAVAAASAHGLEYIPGNIGGRSLVLAGAEFGGEDRTLPRKKLYALRPRGTELAAAVDMVAAMAAKHGPGRWWSTGGAVGYIDDSEGGARVTNINGELHVWLRMYYFHDPVVPQ